MTREEARKAAEVMLAYADGKEVEYKNEALKDWSSTSVSNFDWSKHKYRIKPQPKYRPFKNAEECWQEMQKHHPFGWLQYKDCKDSKSCILSINDEDVITMDYDGEILYQSYETTDLDYTFVDGTPFGIKEE